MSFRNLVQESNAIMVRESMRWEEEGNCMYRKGELLTCYEFDEDGKHKKVYAGRDLDVIAKWMCSNTKNKLICNYYDFAIASTMWEHLDLAVCAFHRAIFGKYTACMVEKGLLGEDEYYDLRLCSSKYT